MTDILSREGIYLWYYFSIQFEQIFKYWVLGILIGSVVSVFGKAKIFSLMMIINRKKWGLFGIIPASIIGIISPLCMYGTIPVASSFYEKGVREDWLAAFMMSSIMLNPQLILYSIALGKTMLIIRILSCFLCGIFAGLLVHYFFRDKLFFNFTVLNDQKNHDMHPLIYMRFLSNVWRNIKATGLYFLVGIALSAIFQRYVRADSFAALFGSENRGFGLLMAATLGVPLYLCGGGTIPLLITWMDNGMSMGSATAFMITGPATKLTNLGAVRIVLGIKNYIKYFVFVVLFALLSGFIVNYIR
jgi:uncharacterized protein